jgi:hypothetical protein
MNRGVHGEVKGGTRPVLLKEREGDEVMLRMRRGNDFDVVSRVAEITARRCRSGGTISWPEAELKILIGDGREEELSRETV